MASSPISLGDFRARIGEHTYARGVNYFEAKTVFDLKQQGSTVRARCQGSRLEAYNLWANFDRGTVVEAFCSCPVGEGGHCKHVVALLLTYRSHKHMVDRRTSKEMLDVSGVVFHSAKSPTGTSSRHSTPSPIRLAPGQASRQLKGGTLLVGPVDSLPEHHEPPGGTVDGGMLGSLGIRRWRDKLEMHAPAPAGEGGDASRIASLEAAVRRLKQELRAKDEELKMERQRNEQLLRLVDDVPSAMNLVSPPSLRLLPPDSPVTSRGVSVSPSGTQATPHSPGNSVQPEPESSLLQRVHNSLPGRSLGPPSVGLKRAGASGLAVPSSRYALSRHLSPMKRPRSSHPPPTLPVAPVARPPILASPAIGISPSARHDVDGGRMRSPVPSAETLLSTLVQEPSLSSSQDDVAQEGNLTLPLSQSCPDSQEGDMGTGEKRLAHIPAGQRAGKKAFGNQQAPAARPQAPADGGGLSGETCDANGFGHARGLVPHGKTGEQTRDQNTGVGEQRSCLAAVGDFGGPPDPPSPLSVDVSFTLSSDEEDEDVFEALKRRRRRSNGLLGS